MENHCESNICDVQADFTIKYPVFKMKITKNLLFFVVACCLLLLLFLFPYDPIRQLVYDDIAGYVRGFRSDSFFLYYLGNRLYELMRSSIYVWGFMLREFFGITALSTVFLIKGILTIFQFTIVTLICEKYLKNFKKTIYHK